MNGNNPLVQSFLQLVTQLYLGQAERTASVLVSKDAQTCREQLKHDS